MVVRFGLRLITIMVRDERPKCPECGFKLTLSARSGWFCPNFHCVKYMSKAVVFVDGGLSPWLK
jgi:tRNA(Ile2) C34 agmatinyltransferase TiaS